MEDLYSNLDNYNEENTIAMLQSENKDLKSKLGEYASTVDKLQQDLDKLTSEYKKLELNYSSLLKTAKAEIERKTQMITNLNLEKDKLVLKSYQNTNTFTVHKNRANGKPKLAQSSKEDKDNKSHKDISPSPHIATERNEQACVPSNDSTVSSNKDLRSKLLNISNSAAKHKDIRADKISDAKENQDKNKTSKSNAHIQNRRKSMSAVRLEIEKFSSDDDEIKSAGSSKDLSMDRTDKRAVASNSQRSRQSSRMSETSSLEDHNSGYHEGSDAYKGRRYSRYDNKIDINRARDKSFHRYKRHSPDRYGKGSRDHHDSSHSSRRLERDRRRVESSPDDRYHWGKNRESQRSSFGRSHPSHEAEREYRSQEKYPMKHKIKHNYDELENKKMKLDPTYRHHDGEWRLQNERDFLEKNYVAESYAFSSCESPDYNHPENPVQQIREIKYTATTKLDDPRISNRKYVLKNNENDGKIALSTAEGRNVAIIPVNKTAWGITPVSMPEALVRIPQETLNTAKEMDREIENPITNISVGSDEINNEALHCPKESINDEIHLNKFDDIKLIEKASQKASSYKIPKLKKTIDDSQIVENTKEVIPLAKPVCEEINSIDGIKQSNAKSTKEKTSSKKNKQDSFRFLGLNDHSNNELPFLECSDQYNTQKYTTAKEVVVDDLELSDDDTCDNSEQPVAVTKDLVDNLLDKNKHQGLNVEQTIKQNTETCERNVKSNKSDNKMKEEKRKRIMSVEPSKGKQSKNKKKQKETKAECVSKDSQVSEKTITKIEIEKDTIAGCVQLSEKTTKTKEKEKKTKTKQVKSKFTELFDDTCSLISPEDLGLDAALTSAAKLPDSVFALEDAQDAADFNVIETAQDLESSENLCNIQNNDIKNIGTVNDASEDIHDTQNKQSIDITEPETGYTVNHEPVAQICETHPLMPEEPIESIYKNLEPETLEKGIDVVKTVIISSGVQPKIIESSSHVSASEAAPQIITSSKEVPIKALATSTPYKVWQSNEVQAVIEAKPPDTDSRMAIVENTLTDNSDTNTLASQSNCTDAPDVRIFVRRRRKVVKK